MNVPHKQVIPVSASEIMDADAVHVATNSLFGMMRESMLRARAEAAEQMGVPPEVLTAFFVESKWEGDEVVIVWDFELKRDDQ